MTLPIDSDKNDDASLAGGSSHIRGNLPADVKQTLETVLHKVMGRAPVFGSSIDRRVVITEASIVPKAEEASRTEARVVCEVTVGEGKVCCRTHHHSLLAPSSLGWKIFALMALVTVY